MVTFRTIVNGIKIVLILQQKNSKSQPFGGIRCYLYHKTKNNMKKQLVVLALLFFSLNTFGQYAQYQFNDTTKAEYPYKLPFWGKLAFDNGFDLPYPGGATFNMFWADQGILISDISIGFNGSDLVDISNIVKFGDVRSEAISINVRPDVWVLPFLNVYGIIGKSYATTTVPIVAPIEFTAVADLEGSSAGIGMTGAGGLGKNFFVLDGNWVWTKMTNFEDPVQTRVFSVRLGRSFKLAKNPKSSLALWAGGMRLRMGAVTEGSILLGDVLPDEFWGQKDEFVSNYHDWYDNLHPIDDRGKIIVADNILTPIVDKIDEGDGSTTVQYRLIKEPKAEWNVLIGGQYQFNKHHQVRMEGGIFGDRSSLLLSYTYRGLFAKRQIFKRKEAK